MKTHRRLGRLLMKPAALLASVMVVLAFCQAPVMAAGNYDIRSIDWAIGVNENGRLDVFERANILSPGVSSSVDFFIPALNYTGTSRPLAGMEPLQGSVVPGKATCFFKDSEDLAYTLSPVLDANTYTVSQDQKGALVRLSPAPQDDPDNVYVLSYTREGAVTRYQDTAVLDLVLVGSGEYGGPIGRGRIVLQFASDVDADDFTVYVHSGGRVEWGQGDAGSLGIIVDSIPSGGLLEIRILMPLSLVPQCTQSVNAEAMPAVEAQEGSAGIPHAVPDPLISWLYPVYSLAAWLLLAVIVYLAYRRMLFAPSDGRVTAPPSKLSPVLASRLVSPMGMDAFVLLAAFLQLVREGFLDLSREQDEKGCTLFRFKQTSKDATFAAKHEKEVLEWVFETGDYEGVTDRDLRRMSLRKPGGYFNASMDVFVSATNDATDAGLLRNVPAFFRWFWMVLALAYALMAVVPMFFGWFEPLVLLVPAAVSLLIRQYMRKVPSKGSIKAAADWRAYAAWLASGPTPGGDADADMVESALLYATALGVGKTYAGRLDGLKTPVEGSRLLVPFTVGQGFSVRLYKRLLGSFQSASFLSAFLRSSPIRSARRQVNERMRKK